MAWSDKFLIILFVCTLINNAHLDNFKFKHHTNDELMAVLELINAKCANISQLFELSEQTVNGRTIWGIIMGENADKHVPLIPEFKYVSSIHGNEIVGKVIIMAFIETLCNAYLNNDEKVRKLMKTTRIHIIPLINVDGFEIAANASYEDRNVITGRTNFNNYDLNRNFPDMSLAAYGFEETSKKKNHHLYKYHLQKDPRQPETIALMKWMNSTPFVLSACLHGGAVVSNYPYDFSPNGNVYTATPDDELFKYLAKTYAKTKTNVANNCTFGQKYFEDGITNGAGWYSLSGGMQDYNYLATNCYEITLELDCVKYPNDDELERLWEENKNSLYEYMLQVHLGIKGIIKDSESGDPIEDAVIHVAKKEENSYEDIWHDVTSNKDGDYYRLLLDGTYNVTVSKEGYTTESKEITVTNKIEEEAKLLHFELKVC